MTLPAFTWADGHAYAVLRRAHPEDPTEPCPFCAQRHVHGPSDGHRIAHCADGALEEIVLTEVTLRRRDGYWLVTTHR